MSESDHQHSLAGVERRHQVLWQVFRCNQDNIEPHLEICMFRVRHQPGLGGGDDALLLRGVTE